MCCLITLMYCWSFDESFELWLVVKKLRLSLHKKKKRELRLSMLVAMKNDHCYYYMVICDIMNSNLGRKSGLNAIWIEEESGKNKGNQL